MFRSETTILSRDELNDDDKIKYDELMAQYKNLKTQLNEIYKDIKANLEERSSLESSQERAVLTK